MKNFSILILIVVLLFATNTVFAQKGSLKKAHQLYKEKKYALAIPHYKKALEENNNHSVASKLAFCYKMNNRNVEAEELYAKITQDKRAKDITFFYYAEVLIENGKYSEAKKWLTHYLELEPDDETAQKYLAACDIIPNISSYFDNVVVEPFSQNSEMDDNAPVFWQGNIVFTSDRKGKFKFLDEKSGWTGRNYLRLYASKLNEDGSYAEPHEYSSKLNVIRKNTGMASFHPKGTELYFSKNGNRPNKNDAYCLQLYVAKSKNGKKWKGADIINFCSREYNYMHPAISPNGQYLYFVSDRPKGNGGTDIYLSKRTKKGWGKPKNLGATINTEEHEGFPFIHPNGKLYFCSKGHAGLGGFDIFVSEKDSSGNWTTPINLGVPVNSPSDDVSIYIDAQEEKGLFTSSREGGDDDIYLLKFPPPAVSIEE